MPTALCYLLTLLQYRKCHRRSEIFPAWLLEYVSAEGRHHRRGGSNREKYQAVPDSAS